GCGLPAVLVRARAHGPAAARPVAGPLRRWRVRCPAHDARQREEAGATIVRVRRLTLGELATNCWLVDDDDGGPVLVIDPADEAQLILETLNRQPVAAIVLTHGHFDHLGAVGEVIAATGAPLLVHEADAGAITTAAANGGA